MPINTQAPNTHSFAWRVHAALLLDRENEFRSMVSDWGDFLQLIDGSGWQVPSHPMDGPALAITTIQDALRLIRERSWSFPQLLYFHSQKYNVSYWLPRIDLVIPVINRQSIFQVAGQLGLFDDQMFMADLQNGMWFIRPDSGLKIFTGHTVSVANGKKCWSSIQRELVHLHKVSVSELIVIAPAKALNPIEWRFWIVNKQVVASSAYTWNDQQDAALLEQVPLGALKVAQAMAANSWQPDIAFVVDVVMYENEFYLNEINAASTSGLYDVDLKLLLPALRSAVISEVDGELSQED